jgi:hypothetical protein
MAEKLCHCGKPLHYQDREIQHKIERLIDELGEYTTVTVAGRSYRVSRHYIALHGLKGEQVPFLGFEQVEKVEKESGEHQGMSRHNRTKKIDQELLELPEIRRFIQMQREAALFRDPGAFPSPDYEDATFDIPRHITARLIAEAERLGITVDEVCEQLLEKLDPPPGEHDGA